MTQSYKPEIELVSSKLCFSDNYDLQVSVWIYRPFLSFSFHVLKTSGADALELNLSCPHGMGERGMGLACGQVRTSTAVNYVCLCDKTGPCTNSYYTLGMEMLKSDDWLETSRSAWFKYLVLKKWKMKEAEIIATV